MEMVVVAPSPQPLKPFPIKGGQEAVHEVRALLHSFLEYSILQVVVDLESPKS
jgi:hypothetical protein